MKKVVLIIAMLTALMITGCSKNEVVMENKVIDGQNTEQNDTNSNNSENDCIYYSVYNLNLSTGKKITNSQLLEIKNYDEDSFLKDMKEGIVI